MENLTNLEDFLKTPRSLFFQVWWWWGLWCGGCAEVLLMGPFGEGYGPGFEAEVKMVVNSDVVAMGVVVSVREDVNVEVVLVVDMVEIGV